ncbi:hypothetical protein L211DRAFT_890853, partial [Terfezia boudieri ATCC MYA-4762]
KNSDTGSYIRVILSRTCLEPEREQPQALPPGTAGMGLLFLEMDVWETNGCDPREPEAKHIGDGTAPQVSARGEVERGSKTAPTVTPETFTSDEVEPRKSAQRGAKGAMTHPSPQRSTLHPSQNVQASQPSLSSRLQPTGKPAGASKDMITPISPITPMHPQKVSALDSDTSQHNACVGRTIRKGMKYSIFRPNPGPSCTSLPGNTSIVPLVDLAKNDKEADTRAPRAPTATIWKDPILPSTYPRNSKHRKERTRLKLTRNESVISNPDFRGCDKEHPSPPVSQNPHMSPQHVSCSATALQIPNREMNVVHSSRRTDPPAMAQTTLSLCSENITEDAEGWELTIASQILTHGPRWEHSVQEPPRVGSPGVIVTDCSTLKSIGPIKEEARYPVLNDDELMKRCWDEKWSWVQFEQAMDLQGWEYNPVLMDTEGKQPVDDSPGQVVECLSSSEVAINSRIDVALDAWHKFRPSCDMSVAETQDSPPMPFAVATPKPEAALIISASAQEKYIPLSLEEVTKLHSPDFHNDNVYWIDGVSYAYSPYTQPTSKKHSTSRTSTSASLELDVENLDSCTPVANPGDQAIPQTEGDSQSHSLAQTSKKTNVKTKKVILRVHNHNPPATTPAPSDASGIIQTIHSQEHTGVHEINAKCTSPTSLTYTDLLYSEPIPSLNWVLGELPFTDFVSVATCDDTGAPIQEAVAHDGHPESDVGIFSTDQAWQAWQLWVNTIGGVPSVQRAMRSLDSLLSTKNTEQPAITHPPEVPNILGQNCEPQLGFPSIESTVLEQEPGPAINLPSLDVMVQEILHVPTAGDGSIVPTFDLVAGQDSPGDPPGQPLPQDLEEGEIASPLDLEEGEIFEAQPPRPESCARSFEDLFAAQVNAYASSTRRRERKKRCIRPEEAFGERNTLGRGKGSQALASLAAQYVDSDGEEQLRGISRGRLHRHGNFKRA